MLNSPLSVSYSGVSSSSCLVCVPGAGCSPGLKAGGSGDYSCRAPGSGRWASWQAFSCAGVLPGCLCTPGASVSCSSTEETGEENAHIRTFGKTLVMYFTACISYAASF